MVNAPTDRTREPAEAGSHCMGLTVAGRKIPRPLVVAQRDGVEPVSAAAVLRYAFLSAARIGEEALNPQTIG